MLKKHMAVLLAVIFAAALFSAEKYAVLITGDYAAEEVPVEMRWQTYQSAESTRPGAMECFWNDTFLMWKMLIEMGYKNENIHVLFANGVDYSATHTIADEYNPAEYTQKPDYKMTDFPATKNNINLVASELSGKLTKDDFLFVWTFDHGGFEGIELQTHEQFLPESEEIPSFLVLLDPESGGYDKIWDYELASIFNPIQANKKVYLMQQCFGGGFEKEMTHIATNRDTEPVRLNNVFFLSASEFNMPANETDNYIVYFKDGVRKEKIFEEVEIEKIANNYYSHGEFNFHIISAITGNKPNIAHSLYYDVVVDGVNYLADYSEVDGYKKFEWYNTNPDGIITVEEAKLWVKDYETFNIGIPYYIGGVLIDPNPVCSDFSNIGFHTSLEYPTIILDNYPDYSSFLKGTMGIPGTLSVNKEDLILMANSNTKLLKGGVIEISNGLNFIIREGSVLEMSDFTEIKNMSGGNIIFENGAKLIIEGKAKITGNIVLEDGAVVEINDDAGLEVNSSTLNVHPATSVSIGKNGVLTIGVNSSLILDGGTPVMLGDNASIFVKDMASLITTNLSTEGVSFRNSGDMWNAIMCEVGSRIELSGAEIIGAYTGVWGAPSMCSITNSSFLNCENGISLINCPDYEVANNRLIGKGLNSYGYAQGAGITLTSCSMPVSENTVQNYAEGIKLVSSSITLSKNKLINNFNSGLLITGNGSKPVLVNSLVRDLIPRLNNEIYGNNIDYPLYNGAQIYMRYSAGAYMTGGYNNIYSGLSGVVPSVPCIRGIINTTEPRINKVLIAAERNYWGYGSINALNQDDFFFFRHSTFDTGYSIDYDPYAVIPYTADGSASTDLSTNEPRTTEATMLLNAMKLEDTGSSKASIKLYENIIKKYPMTPEYYVAESRLPGLYIEEEMPLTALLSSFDEAIENETVLGKKFFKGLRVSTHIKAKNYDTAIMYAEEMKNEAETDEEALLSEIDIAVANLMKDAEGKWKSGNSSDQLEKLLEMLNGKEPENSPADIAENNLPSHHDLYQNYPNPFNPITQIKFALSITADVRLSVFNISGQKVAELANGVMNAGSHAVDFDGSSLNSGVYYYTLETDGKAMTKKMLMVK